MMPATCNAFNDKLDALIETYRKERRWRERQAWHIESIREKVLDDRLRIDSWLENHLGASREQRMCPTCKGEL